MAVVCFGYILLESIILLQTHQIEIDMNWKIWPLLYSACNDDVQENLDWQLPGELTKVAEWTVRNKNKKNKAVV